MGYLYPQPTPQQRQFRYERDERIRKATAAARRANRDARRRELARLFGKSR
jgi:hypothetical protein